MKKINLIILIILLSLSAINGQNIRKSSSFKEFVDGENIYQVHTITEKIQKEDYKVKIVYNVSSVQDNVSKLNISFVSNKLNWTHSLMVDEFEQWTGIETEKRGFIGEFELSKIENNLLFKFRITMCDNEGVIHYFPCVYNLNLKNHTGDLSLENRSQFELEKESGLRFYESTNKTIGITIKYCEFSKLGGNFSINDCPVILEVGHKGGIHTDTLNTRVFAKELYLKSVTGFRVSVDALPRNSVDKNYSFSLHFTGEDEQGQEVTLTCPIKYDYKATYQETNQVECQESSKNNCFGEYFTLEAVKRVIWHFKRN